MRERQQGVALITAVLIVALVTTIAVAMASRQQLDIRRSANVFDTDQAWLAVMGGEDYARNVLIEDSKNSGNSDALDENWAQPVQFPFEDMVLSGVMEDMQGRFNINNLLDSSGVPVPLELARFRNLLRLLDLDPSIADATLDWLDKDVDVKANGAEDGYYMQQQPGYRTANHLMASTSELRLVRGMTADAYEKLAPFITVLPETTPININTASATVLAILGNNLTLADVVAAAREGTAGAAGGSLETPQQRLAIAHFPAVSNTEDLRQIVVRPAALASGGPPGVTAGNALRIGDEAA